MNDWKKLQDPNDLRKIILSSFEKIGDYITDLEKKCQNSIRVADHLSNSPHDLEIKYDFLRKYIEVY